jgi:putative transposase
VLMEIQRLIVRMADENPTWGSTRIQGAEESRPSRRPLDDSPGVEEARCATRARPSDLAADLPPSAWGAIAGADFFTTEVWTWRGLVTYYTVFVIDLASRRGQVLGSTPHPDEAFMCQVGRNLTLADEWSRRVLICDRDAKWTNLVHKQLRDVESGSCAHHTKRQTRRPTRNVSCGRSRRNVSIGAYRSASATSGAQSPSTSSTTIASDHQGLGNELIDPVASQCAGRACRRPRLGGLLNYYARAV